MEAYLGLFASGFLAATLLPLSSEAVLVALVAAGGYDVGLLWFAASLGNSLGAAVNWALGRLYPLAMIGTHFTGIILPEGPVNSWARIAP